MLSPSVLISAGLLHLLDPVVLLIAMVSVTVVLRRRGCRNRDAEPRRAVHRRTAESRHTVDRRAAGGRHAGHKPM